MTPRRLLCASALLLALFAVLHLAGLRAWTSVASLIPPPGVPFPIAVAGALAYAVTWLAAVIVAPVLALAAAFLAVARVSARLRRPAR